jgi:uncharacterized integral membrane protein (TIGR00698 family)
MTERPWPRRPTLAERLLLGTTIDRIPSLIPGVALAAAVVVVSVLVADVANDAWGFDGVVSFILLAIVFGMIIRNTIGLHEVFGPGIAFSLRKLLRLGIVLMGIRLSVLDVLEIGGFGIPVVIGAVLTGLLVATAATRALRLPERLGTLIAIGTGICGATAIVATAPGIDARDEEVAYAIANITIFGIAAMFLYPFLGDLIFGGDITRVGLFMGTAIHETAQVAGAGLIYDQAFDVTVAPSGADVAVIAKLVRNAFMVVAIPAVTFAYTRRAEADGRAREGGILRLVPVFLFGFLAMAGLRTIGDAGIDGGGDAFGIWGADAWDSLTDGIRTWAGYILATAMAGVGLGTSIAQLRGLGAKPFLVGIAAAAAVGGVSIALVFVFGPLISV